MYRENNDKLPYTGNIFASSKDNTSVESASESFDGQNIKRKCTFLIEEKLPIYIGINASVTRAP